MSYEIDKPSIYLSKHVNVLSGIKQMNGTTKIKQHINLFSRYDVVPKNASCDNFLRKQP